MSPVAASLPIYSPTAQLPHSTPCGNAQHGRPQLNRSGVVSLLEATAAAAAHYYRHAEDTKAAACHGCKNQPIPCEHLITFGLQVSTGPPRAAIRTIFQLCGSLGKLGNSTRCGVADHSRRLPPGGEHMLLVRPAASLIATATTP